MIQTLVPKLLLAARYCFCKDNLMSSDNALVFIHKDGVSLIGYQTSWCIFWIQSAPSAPGSQLLASSPRQNVSSKATHFWSHFFLSPNTNNFLSLPRAPESGFVMASVHSPLQELHSPSTQSQHDKTLGESSFPSSCPDWQNNITKECEELMPHGKYFDPRQTRRS